MKLKRVSNFPLNKPFVKLPADTQASEVVLRLVENFNSGTPRVLGSATILCGNLLVTAKHVFDEMCRAERDQKTNLVMNNEVVAIQILPGPVYNIWTIMEGVSAPQTDLVLLRVASEPASSEPERDYEWKQPQVNPFPPIVGEKVAAFGFRLGGISTSINSNGGRHIDLNDEGMGSVGMVREIHEWRCDNFLRPFPCYQVSARFDGGMSGGPVYDETGRLCGIVCSSISNSHLDGEPISYVSTLWPIFSMIINADRGDRYPRNVSYPVIDLARRGIIAVPEIEKLELWFSKYAK